MNEMVLTNMLVFTAESYSKTYPNSSLEKYYNDLHLPIIEQEKFLYGNEKLDLLRKIVIDESFFEWLNKKELKNTTNNRLEYAKQMDDDTAKTLWAKNFFDKEIVMTQMVIVLSSKSNNYLSGYKLSNECLRSIKSLFGEHYDINHNQLIIGNQLLTPSIFNDEIKRDYEYNFYKYIHNKDICFNYPTIKKDLEQIQNNIGIVVLPIAAIIPRKCIISRPFFTTNRVELGIEADISYITSKIEDNIKKDLLKMYEVENTLCYPELIDFEDFDRVYNLISSITLPL